MIFFEQLIVEMELFSPDFENGSTIQAKFTCRETGIRPILRWTVPNAVASLTKSFALICHDPDAPHPGGWSHWVVQYIPPTAREISVNTPIVEGYNSWGIKKWGAPCPPKGDKPHRYIFKIFALNNSFEKELPMTVSELWKAIKKSTCYASAGLVGFF